MRDDWRVLVVDGDLQVHESTRRILGEERWWGRSIELSFARTEAEARSILASAGPPFHVVLLELSLETPAAGLELCRRIRKHCPRSTRIAVRTGHPELVPEETVLSEHDVDLYLSKAEATPARVLSAVRACLRSSQDISTLLAYGRQLESFTQTLRHLVSVDDLLVFMGEAIKFLELKHGVDLHFLHDDESDDHTFLGPQADALLEDKAKVRRACQRAHALPAEHLQLVPGPRVGLTDQWYVVPFMVERQRDDERGPYIRGGAVFEIKRRTHAAQVRDLVVDLRLFLESWCITYGNLQLREHLEHERLLRERMYRERMEGIASMVTGVAHELNTPLGVAATSASLIVELAEGLAAAGDDEERAELVADVRESCELLRRNLERANHLIKGFKELSTSQLSDERSDVDLPATIRSCFESMGPELRKRGITWELVARRLHERTWDGFAGHLSQVIINLIQNTIRYAYDEGTEGTIEVVVEGTDEGFSIHYRDHGRGVRPDILPQMFQAFVTSGRDRGGRGLGMAISRNIVVNLLGGTIECTSEPGQGVDFAISLPAVAKAREGASISFVRGAVPAG